MLISTPDNLVSESHIDGVWEKLCTSRDRIIAKAQVRREWKTQQLKLGPSQRDHNQETEYDRAGGNPSIIWDVDAPKIPHDHIEMKMRDNKESADTEMAVHRELFDKGLTWQEIESGDMGTKYHGNRQRFHHARRRRDGQWLWMIRRKKLGLYRKRWYTATKLSHLGRTFREIRAFWDEAEYRFATRRWGEDRVMQRGYCDEDAMKGEGSPLHKGTALQQIEASIVQNKVYSKELKRQKKQLLRDRKVRVDLDSTLKELQAADEREDRLIREENLES